MADATKEERARANLLADRAMVEALWVLILSQTADPLADAAALEQHTLAEFEQLLSHVRGRDAEVTQHLAIDAMELRWQRIRTTLAEHFAPRPWADETPS